MFLGKMDLKCMQRTIVYPSYIIIDEFNKEVETLKIEEDTAIRYLDKYRKYKSFSAEGWDKTRWKKYREGRFRNKSIPKQYRSVIVGVSTSTEGNEFKIFDPLNDFNNLFIDLAKIKSILNTEAVLKFVENYGLPSPEHWLLANGYTNMDVPMTTLYELEREYSTYKECYELFFAYKEDNYGKLKSLLEYNEGIGTLRIDNHVSLAIGKEIKSKARERILTKINRRAVRYNTVMGIDSPYMEVRFRNLFDVAYFQIGKSLLEDAALGICEECGGYFAKTHGNRKYCPPPPHRAGEPSSCQNNNRVDAYRKRNREKIAKKRAEFFQKD